MKKIIFKEFNQKEEILINENKGTVKITTYRNGKKVTEEKRKINEYIELLEYLKEDNDCRNSLPYEDIIAFIIGEEVACDFCFKKLRNTMYVKVIVPGLVLCRKCFYALSKLRKEMQNK